MFYQVSQRNFWVNTLQQIYVEANLKTTDKEVNERALERFRNQERSATVLPSTIFCFDRSWSWGNSYNFNIGNTTNATALSAEPESREAREERENKERFQKLFWTALAILPVAVGYFAYTLKEYNRSKVAVETYSEIAQGQQLWTDFALGESRFGRISLDLKKIIHDHLQIDNLIQSEKYQKMLIAAEILLSGAVLLISSIVASKLLADAAIIGLVVGVCGLIGQTIYNWDLDDELKRAYTKLKADVVNAMNRIQANPTMQHFGPQLATVVALYEPVQITPAITPLMTSAPAPSAPPAFNWDETKAIFSEDPTSL